MAGKTMNMITSSQDLTRGGRESRVLVGSAGNP